MKIRSTELLYLLAGTRIAVAWEHSSEDEFRRAIAGHNHALVAFIEPTTAASQVLEPEWTSAAESEKKSLISVDCASAASLCKEFDVISYPALRFFDGHGKMTPYRGPRRRSSILSYLKRAVRPTVMVLNSEKKAVAFQSSDDYAVVARINPQDQHVKILYDTLASQYRDRLSFGSAETDKTTTVTCYNNRDSQQFTISDLTAIDALPQLIENCLTPVIGEFTRTNEMKYLQSGKSLVFYFSSSFAERETYVAAMRSVAKMYKEYLSFVTVDANEYGDLAAPLGLVPGIFPALSVQNPMFGKVFPYPRGRDIAPEVVGAFLMDIGQGKVEPWDGTMSADGGRAHDEL
ncbi:Protein disulfide-isomerase [Daldinia childiae]|uniref:Protein disulfide-isomerase n=1 Tax=Daldinia childiae TaxID=326645 RepID=UPI0014474686|nr:Protein disulfide-isomerase [Daldinia childiae]KAF3070789.1 Protein disulfide-isomerase [Daldinia childiae]